MKPEFRKIPSMHIIDGGWRLAGQLVYYSEYLGREIIIPTGFETDLASVPEIVPTFIVDVGNGPSRLPAIVHDFLCYTPVQKALKIKQRHADRVFREANATRGLGWFKRGALWLPTRIFQFFTSPFKKTGPPPIHNESRTS